MCQASFWKLFSRLHGVSFCATNLDMSKTPKSAIIRARCEPELADFYGSQARLRGLDEADVVREALRDYRSRWQERMRTITQQVFPMNEAR